MIFSVLASANNFFFFFLRKSESGLYNQLTAGAGISEKTPETVRFMAKICLRRAAFIFYSFHSFPCLQVAALER